MRAFFDRWRFRLLFIVLALLVAAIVLSGVAFSRPVESEESVVLVTYEHQGKFDYVIKQKPSYLYGDLPIEAVLKPPVTPSPAAPTPSPPQVSQKTLRPGDTIYTRLFEAANFTYTYKLHADTPLRQISEETEIHVTLEDAGVWSKTFVLVAPTSATGPFTLSFDIDADDLNLFQAVFKAVEAETGTTVSNSMTLVATVHVTALTDFGQINETFQQTLSTTLGQDKLEWKEKLETFQSSTIRKNQEVANSLFGMPVTQMGTVFAIVALIFLLVLALLVVLNLKFKPVGVSAMETRAKTARRKYKDTIVDINQLSEPKAEETILQVTSLTELIKISDTLMKPVLHMAGPEWHLYCIIDGKTRYQYFIGQETDD